MSELIERQAVIDAMNSEGYTKNMRVHRKILSIPAVDAVHVRPGRKERNMSDLIHREAVREFIKSYRHSTDVAFHMEDHLDEIPASSPWHRVEEELPPMLYQAEDDDFCIDYSLLVFAYREASHDFYLARQMDDGHGATWGTDRFDELYGVTHWMPLPEPPKEEV